MSSALPRFKKSALATVVAAAAIAGLTALPAHADTGSQIAAIANANIGNAACSTNSAGTTGYESSCSGGPELWCADFAKWVWQQDGVDVTGLTPGAGSFGQYNGGLHSTPHVGDAVVFNYNGNGYADHVAIVTAVNSDGTIQTVGGDEGGQSGNWAATSHVHNDGPYSGAIGYSSYMGQNISGYVSPKGGATSNPTPPPAPAPPAPTVSHVFALGSDNRIYNNDGNYTAGKWNGYTMVDSTAGFKQTTAASIGSTVHLYAIGSDDRVYGNDGDFLDGKWNGYKLVDSTAGFKQITAAATGSTVRLYALGSDNRVYENDGDYSKGTWSGFKLVDSTAGFKQITAVAIGNTVHLMAIGSDDRVYNDNGDFTAGKWSGFNLVDGTAGFQQITADASGNTVHLYALGSDKRVYDDEGDFAAGKWSGYNLIDGTAGFQQISAAPGV